MARLGVAQQREHIDIDELKASCDLRDIIVPHLEKARQGNGGEYWLGCCPFHDDRNPSFKVSKESYYCFGCEQWGSVTDWYGHLHPNLELYEVLQLIADEYGRPTGLPATRKKVKIEVPQVEPLPFPMDVSELDKYPLPTDVKEWVMDKWLLSEQTIEQERIGYDERQGAIVIPIWAGNDLITLRFRNYDNPNMGKYWGIADRNDVYGYGRHWLDAQFAIVVFGEMTACFLHHEWGFATFSWTNGCKSFKPYLKPLLAHLVGGVIIPDVGEEEAAAMTAHALGAEYWKVAMLDAVGGEKGDDVIDWVKKGGAKEQFANLLLNHAVELRDGILQYWSGRFTINWRR